jgi:hypothetical protein
MTIKLGFNTFLKSRDINILPNENTFYSHRRECHAQLSLGIAGSGT